MEEVATQLKGEPAVMDPQHSLPGWRLQVVDYDGDEAIEVDGPDRSRRQ